MLVGGRQRQRRWTLLRDILIKHIEDSEEFLYVSVFVFTDLALWRCIQRKATNSPDLRITIMLCEIGSGPGLASMKGKRQQVIHHNHHLYLHFLYDLSIYLSIYLSIFVFVLPVLYFK